MRAERLKSRISIFCVTIVIDEFVKKVKTTLSFGVAVGVGIGS